ncbi:MAG: PLDc N-terminal domain-containing protein [Geobacter sp.]|nr:PLDc N-terminal domain-containing protein [Geobacter sp.]
METVKFGLMLSIIPFTVIFLVITIWWALVDLSLRKIERVRKIRWALLILLLPLVGSYLYNLLVRQQDAEQLA